MVIPKARILSGIALTATAMAAPGAAQSPQQPPAGFDAALLSSFTYRNVGPFRMSARVSDIAVPDAPIMAHRNTIYVSFWTGGLWKTTNNGTTFTPLFDTQDKLTIGAIAIAHSNPEELWVGTGDAFTSRSSFAGNGVYRSLDAGKTWQHMGLVDTQHIARIRIDPRDPNNVYVAAMGHLYSNTAERGVFHTTDGGKTWKKVLYVNDHVGVIDLVMDPEHPDTLYAATYDKKRLPWQLVEGGPGSGIYKTTDGGKTWRRLAGGLPSGRIGRIGLTLYPKNPNIVYAVIENAHTTKPIGPDDKVSTMGEIYRTDDAGAHWRKMNPANVNVMPKGPYYFTQIRVDPNDANRIIVTGEPFKESNDGGKTWHGPIMDKMFGDFRTLWFDPENSNHILTGSDGGLGATYDGGKTSKAFNTIPVNEIYTISLDNDQPYNIYAAIQDHEHWRGPSQGPMRFGVSPRDWQALSDGDGEWIAADPTDSRWVYMTREYGGHTRLDQKLGYETNIQPTAPVGQPPYRFLWTPPLVLSPHNPKTLYTGGQMLLRSTDRGNSWQAISPDLSTHPVDKIMRESEAGLPGGIPWFAISTISESPVKAGVIWAGTADGNVQMTADDGAHWIDMTAKLTALGARRDGYVSRVQASHFLAGRAYVSKSGYKFDDFHPYLYRTDDYGKTWQDIAGNLPDAPIDVVYEDPINPNLIFVGNDTGVFVSLTGGGHWVKMNNNIPDIAVFDIKVQRRAHDLVLGSYGRGIWITNIDALEQLNSDVLASDAHLFDTQPAFERIHWCFGANDYLFGDNHVVTPNPRSAMMIRYYLKAPAPTGATLTITDADGEMVALLHGPGKVGINSVSWTMRKAPATPDEQDCTAYGDKPVPPIIDQLEPPGDYSLRVDVDGHHFSQAVRIAGRQGWSLGPDSQAMP